jgi:hypothetical protein
MNFPVVHHDACIICRFHSLHKFLCDINLCFPVVRRHDACMGWRLLTEGICFGLLSVHLLSNILFEQGMK